MKNFLLLFFAALVLVSCDEKTENPGLVDFSVQFKGYFGDDPLVMYNQSYSYEDNMDLKFQLFQFYVSDLSLLRLESGDESAVKLSDIELISFGDVQSMDEAEEGVTLTFNEVPAGNYAGLKLGLGVSADLNATQPGDYAPPHPLDGHYWSWARGYVFTKVEGNADLNGDGIFEEKLTFHIGENNYFRELIIDEPIEVGKDGNITLSVDLSKVLKDVRGEFLNFREVTQDHTTNPDVAGFIADNLPGSIQLQ